MTLTAIHHVSLNVTDVPAAIDFYVNGLGLHQREDRPDFSFDGAWLDVGTQQVHLIEAPAPDRLGQHFAVAVDDLDAAVAELRERGLDVGDPKPVGRARQAFLSDPSGNVIELHQPPAR